MNTTTEQATLNTATIAKKNASSSLLKRTSTEKKFSVFGVAINKISFNNAVHWIYETSVLSNSKQTTCHFVNADCLNKAYIDKDYKNILNRTDKVFADGSGVRLACRLKKIVTPENINGTDLFPAICKLSKQKKLKIFLLGGKPGVAQKMYLAVSKQYPNVDFVGAMDGYFSKAESKLVIETINKTQANLLLVGMGAPLQEKWLNTYRHEIKANVCMGVGGLFDYYSNNIPRAPMWMRKTGCEWIWRFMQEPTRLAKRYFVGNFVFVYRVWKEAHTAQRKQLFNGDLNPLLTQHRQTAESGNLMSRILFNKKFSLLSNNLLVRYFHIEKFTQHLLKRSLDVITASVASIALSPIIILTVLLIKLESPGNILFSQTRIGKNGEPFKLWKFRSMFIDAEERKKALLEANEMAGGVTFKMKNDPRITRVGSFIRKYSIDELPQLWNVLNGSMSIVGPRPALAVEVNEYNASDRQRLKVAPGITCIWQVSGRSDINFKNQVKLDQLYISKRCFWADIKLILSTIPAVLTARGAY